MKECKVYMYSVLDQQRYMTPDHLQLPAHANYYGGEEYNVY